VLKGLVVWSRGQLLSWPTCLPDQASRRHETRAGRRTHRALVNLDPTGCGGRRAGDRRGCSVRIIRHRASSAREISPREIRAVRAAEAHSVLRRNSPAFGDVHEIFVEQKNTLEHRAVQDS
jgi:hypothetical protein